MIYLLNFAELEWSPVSIIQKITVRISHETDKVCLYFKIQGKIKHGPYGKFHQIKSISEQPREGEDEE